MLKCIVIDVDGTMTDAGIYYDENGNELKKFCTKDAAGFFAAHAAKIKTIVITGRKCNATEKRMCEMKVDYLFQNIKDKKTFLKSFMEENHYEKTDMGYIGDDLNDLGAMDLCSFIGCPKDSCKEVLEKADYISSVSGGYGAVRDVIEFLLRTEGVWNQLVSEMYGIGI